MRNRHQYEIKQVLTNEICNVGWNNFSDVPNGYTYKPGRWRGMYKKLYVVSDEKPKDDEYGFVPLRTVSDPAQVSKGLTDPEVKKITMTNDPKLEGLPKFTEDFERVFVETHGSIHTIEVDENFSVLRYKTWWQGNRSEWITFDPTVKGVKPKDTATLKREIIDLDSPNALKSITAYDIVQHLYSDTITKMCLDLEHQVLDTENFLSTEKVELEHETNLKNEVEQKVRKLKGLLQVLKDNFYLGKDDERLCEKYQIKKTETKKETA